MGKKIFAAMIVAVTMSFAGYNIYQSQRMDTMSDLMLANVEALARGEDSGCPNGCIDNGDGCTCNGVHYPKWLEYPW